MGLTLVFGVVAVAFLAMTGAALYHLQWAHRLPSWEALGGALTNENSEATGPRCSAVVAARDEASRIEASVRRLLAQRGVQMEVIVVDDRSTDGTDAIVQRLAAEDARVRLVRVDALPDGWLGKCHACHVGAGLVTGEWVLFTDADCWLRPDVIARALRVAHREQADHITLSPGVAPETLAAKACHLIFLVSLADWLSRVNRDRPRAFLGIGAFNLMRTAAYRECGGYEKLRLTVVDDIKLGLLLRRAGKRTRGFIGADDAECHWGTTAWNLVKIMEKNHFAILEFRVAAALASGVGGMALWSLAVVGLLSGTAAGLAAAAALATLILPAGICARRIGWSLAGAVATPFVLPLLFYTALNSMWVTLRQGGIRWRDTFYPLAALREGGVR